MPTTTLAPSSHGMPTGTGNLECRAWLPFGRRSALALACGLAMLFTLLRAYAMLGPLGARPLFLLHCVLLALVPWLLFGSRSRAQLGLQKSQRAGQCILPVGCGVLAACVCFVIGYGLFGASDDNWFVGVGHAYFNGRPPGLTSLPILYLMFTIPAMIFSPIGEEIFSVATCKACWKRGSTGAPAQSSKRPGSPAPT